jgi:hypothetical protein
MVGDKKNVRPSKCKRHEVASPRVGYIQGSFIPTLHDEFSMAMFTHLFLDQIACHSQYPSRIGDVYQS